MLMHPYFSYTNRDGNTVHVSGEGSLSQYILDLRMQGGMTEDEANASFKADQDRSMVARKLKVMVVRKSLPTYKSFPIKHALKPYHDGYHAPTGKAA